MDTSTQASIDFYDTLWSATTRVDQHHKCRGRAIENIMRALPAPTDRCRAILELGCGSGIISALLARHGDVTGIDQSSAGVEAARASVAGRFEIGMLPDIAIDARDFDVCVLTQVIEHFTDDNQMALLQNARAVVRPGGHLILTTPNRPVSERMRFARGELQPIENWLDTADLHALLAKAGWRVLQTSYAFNFLPVLASRLPVFRGARYLAYDVLGLRNVVEGLLESRPGGDTTVVLATKA